MNSESLTQKAAGPASLRVMLLRVTRMAMLAAVALGVRQAGQGREAARAPQATLEEARQVVPQAAAVLPPQDGTRWQQVAAGDGQMLGSVRLTLPDAKPVRGYIGASQVIVARDARDTVTGWALLESPDTPEHVAMMLGDETFAGSWRGWKPGTPVPDVLSVTGATLTSRAVAVSLERALSGGENTASLFPEKVTVTEARGLFPAATGLAESAGRLRVEDESGVLLGWLVRSSPAADDVRGYQGPVEVLAALDPAGEKVTGVQMRRSFDNKPYTEYVREDTGYLASLAGRTRAETAVMDFAKEGIEGVSGATLTSYAVAESLKRRMAAPDVVAETVRSEITAFAWKDALLGIIVLGGCVMAFTPLRGYRMARMVWQVMLLGIAGLSLGALLSVHLLGGWMLHGMDWQQAPGLALLALAALGLPWAARRQVYCHQLCPHGAAQSLAGKLVRRKWRVPPRWDAWLRRVPACLLGLALLSLVAGWGWRLAALEPFDAWVPQAGNVASLVLAVLGLGASLFVPQAYCHYGCPTGALLRFMRSTGRNDRWAAGDWMALGCVVLAWSPLIWKAAAVKPVAAHAQAYTLRGQAMGMPWSVTLRQPVPEGLESRLRARLGAVEALISTWRKDSVLSGFNAVHHTDAVPVPEALAALARQAASVGAATGGALDGTLQPVIAAWGYGPNGVAGEPDDKMLASLREICGWDLLEISGESLRKRQPSLQLDLTAVGEGYALEQLAAELDTMRAGDYLLELGGELKARGTWQAGVEASRHRRSLTDSALSTSGTTRQHRRGANGAPISHIIDPRTGRPVEHDTLSVTVCHADAVLADGWATALMVLGCDEGREVADRCGIAAEFTSARGVYASHEWSTQVSGERTGDSVTERPLPDAISQQKKIVEAAAAGSVVPR